MVADKSYRALNSDMANYGLQIRLPHTMCDLTLERIPYIVKEVFGGLAVSKYPTATLDKECIL